MPSGQVCPAQDALGEAVTRQADAEEKAARLGTQVVSLETRLAREQADTRAAPKQLAAVTGAAGAERAGAACVPPAHCTRQQVGDV